MSESLEDLPLESFEITKLPQKNEKDFRDSITSAYSPVFTDTTCAALLRSSLSPTMAFKGATAYATDGHEWIGERAAFTVMRAHAITDYTADEWKNQTKSSKFTEQHHQAVDGMVVRNKLLPHHQAADQVAVWNRFLTHHQTADEVSLQNKFQPHYTAHHQAADQVEVWNRFLTYHQTADKMSLQIKSLSHHQAAQEMGI